MRVITKKQLMAEVKTGNPRARPGPKVYLIWPAQWEGSRV